MYAEKMARIEIENKKLKIKNSICTVIIIINTTSTYFTENNSVRIYESHTSSFSQHEQGGNTTVLVMHNILLYTIHFLRLMVEPVTIAQDYERQ